MKQRDTGYSPEEGLNSVLELHVVRGGKQG